MFLDAYFFNKNESKNNKKIKNKKTAAAVALKQDTSLLPVYSKLETHTIAF